MGEVVAELRAWAAHFEEQAAPLDSSPDPTDQARYAFYIHVAGVLAERADALEQPGEPPAVPTSSGIWPVFQAPPADGEEEVSNNVD